MPKQQIEKINRVTKPYGRVMVGVAVLFDLIPILLLCLVFYVVVDSLGGFSAVAEAFDSGECVTYELDSGAGVGLDFGSQKTGTVCEKTNIVAKTKLGLAFVSGGTAIFFLGPIIYTIGSFAATLFAFVLFTLWFYAKGVNMWSFSKTGRVFANAFSALIESVPLLNIFPGITFMVWRHVKVTQAEDIIKNKETVRKSLRVIQGGGQGRRLAKAA